VHECPSIASLHNYSAKNIDKTAIICMDDVSSASEKNKRKANALASALAKKQVKKALFPQK
jgi:hypothetical protein